MYKMMFSLMTYGIRMEDIKKMTLKEIRLFAEIAEEEFKNANK